MASVAVGISPGTCHIADFPEGFALPASMMSEGSWRNLRRQQIPVRQSVSLPCRTQADFI